MAKFIKINPSDNVAVAIENLSKGEQLNVEGTEVTLIEDVPAGHKFTLKDVAEGEDVIKYGFPIGHAKKVLKKAVGHTMRISRRISAACSNILGIRQR